MEVIKDHKERKLPKEEMSEDYRMRWWHDTNVARWKFMQSRWADKNLKVALDCCRRVRDYGITIETGMFKGKIVGPKEVCTEDGFGALATMDGVSKDRDGYYRFGAKKLSEMGVLEEATKTYFGDGK